MLVVVLLGIAMIATWTWALWPQPEQPRPEQPQPEQPRSEQPRSRKVRPGKARSEAAAQPGDAQPADAPGPHPVVAPLPRVESTEGLLVAQLLRGELTGRQYTRAMECLAARDADRHPVTVPSDGA